MDFLRRLGDGLGRTGCRCFAWALMPNHLHLLLLSGVRGLVDLLHPLLTGYAVTFNLKYHRIGHLFQNRYKAIICDEDPYFLELVRYIGLQPVRAGIVHTPQELARYPWTSHRAMMGGSRESWLEMDDVLGRFGPSVAQARPVYEQYMVDGWNQGRRDDLEGGGLLRSVGGMENLLALRRSGEQQMADIRILGDGTFVETILRQAEALEQTNKGIRQEWSTEELRLAVTDFTMLDTAAIMSRSRRRPIANARAILTYASREWLGLNGTEVGRWLGLSSGSVSKAYERGERLTRDGRLLEFLERKKGSSVP